jgi:hypothetical protein
VLHHRRWLALALVVPAASAMLLGFPATAHASIGVGVQAGPVRLGSMAHPGGSYALPPVYVVNTGTQAESIAVRVERLSRGGGRTVPPSWVHVTGPAVRLARHQAARIPLQLVVPDGARPGEYLSDIVVTGSAAVSVGSANLGVAAATKLQFSVAPGPASGPWPSLPGWAVPAIAGFLLLAAAIFAFRRSGLRVRVERKPGEGSSVDGHGGHSVA